MQIEPIQLGAIGSGSIIKQKTNSQAATGFQDVFKNTWNTAVSTQDDLAKQQYLQSIGEIDDTYTVPIAASKAELSLNLLVSLRNKALDAYNELMRINV